MSATTIEWTDQTWNPTGGCDRISPGCAHCYAKEQWDRRHKASVAGKPMAPQYAKPFEVLQLFENRLLEPLKWKAPRRVFVNSVSDLFHEDVPDAFIDKVFAVMALAPRHTFQILTKRAERMRDYLTKTVDGWGRAARIAAAAQVVCGFDGQSSYNPSKAAKGVGGLVLPDADVFWIGSCNPPDQPYRERWILKTWPLRNVWLGVSVENQHFAHERISLLLQTPAAVRFISAEPLLGPVLLDDGCNSWLTCTSTLTQEEYEAWPDEKQANHHCCERWDAVGEHYRGLDWLIVGGESGPGARPFDLAWARSIVQQCKEAGVACFVKQLGPAPRVDGPPGDSRRFVLDLTSRKGGDPAEWPEDLRVRQYPEARA